MTHPARGEHVAMMHAARGGDAAMTHPVRRSLERLARR